MSVLWLRAIVEQMCRGRRYRERHHRTPHGKRPRLDCTSLESRTMLSGSGVIQGSVWYDIDADQFWDSNERPIADRVVYLDQNGNGTRDADELATRTDVAGAYALSGVEAGTYAVRQELPDRWSQTYPAVRETPNILLTHQNTLREFTLSGEFVREMPVPAPSGNRPPTGLGVNDVIVDPAGRIHVLNYDSGRAYISTYTPSVGTWEHHTRPGLRPAGNGWDGEISVQGNYLYYGFTRFNINDWTYENFVPVCLADVRIGLDGLLYGWGCNYPHYHVGVLNPADYSVIRSITAWIDNASVAANVSGDIFAVALDGGLFRFDSAGELIDRDFGSYGAVDLDLSRDGLLVIGHSSGDVEIFRENFTNVSVFSGGSVYGVDNTIFTAFSTYEGTSAETIRLQEGQVVQPLNLASRNDSPNLTLSISENDVVENAANGTVVATFAEGGDFHAPMSFSLVDSAQGRFAIVGNELQVADGVRLNYEAQSAYYVTVRAVDYWGVSLDKAFRIDILDVNEPPTARAGGPYAVRAGARITLDGSGSDPDQSSATLVYEWDLDDDGVFGEVGASAPRGDESAADPVFRAVGLTGPTTYPVALRVTDYHGLSHTATVNVRIDENKAPTAVAGGPYTVREDRIVTLDGSGSSDPEQPAADLLYVWYLDEDEMFGETGAAAARGDELGAYPVFRPNGLLGPRTVSVSLRVTDDGGLLNVAPTQVQIVTNEPPIAVSGGPYRVLAGRTRSLDGGNSRDVEQPSASLVYEWDLDGDAVFGEVGSDAQHGDETGARPTFSAAGLLAASTFSISLRVTDDGGKIDIDTTDMLVSENEPPIAVPGGPYSVVKGATVTLDASGSSDLDQATDTLIFNWDLDGDGAFGESGAAATRGDERGMRPVFSAAAFTSRSTVPVTLRVTDDAGLAGEATTNIQVRLPSDPTLTDGELRIAGTSAADVITIGISESAAEIVVGVNSDSFRFALTAVTSYFIDGGMGDDSIGVGENVLVRGQIRGGAGNDQLSGGGGDEELLGGDGNDRLNGGPGDDLLLGEAGDDILLASRGRDILRPGPGNNSVQLGSLTNSLLTLSVDAAIAAVSGKRSRRATFSPNVSGSITASFDKTLAGSMNLSINDNSTPSIDGHTCTGTLSVSATGTVSRLKYRADLGGSVQISCSGLGSARGSVSGLATGSISLERGVVATRGNMQISFGGRRPSRNSLAGTALITEVITEIA